MKIGASLGSPKPSRSAKKPGVKVAMALSMRPVTRIASGGTDGGGGGLAVGVMSEGLVRLAALLEGAAQREIEVEAVGGRFGAGQRRLHRRHLGIVEVVGLEVGEHPPGLAVAGPGGERRARRGDRLVPAAERLAGVGEAELQAGHRRLAGDQLAEQGGFLIVAAELAEQIGFVREDVRTAAQVVGERAEQGQRLAFMAVCRRAAAKSPSSASPAVTCPSLPAPARAPP